MSIKQIVSNVAVNAFSGARRESQEIANSAAGEAARKLAGDVANFSQHAIDAVKNNPGKAAAIAGAVAVAGVAVAQHEEIGRLASEAIHHITSGSEHALASLDKLQNQVIGIVEEHPVKTAIVAGSLGMAIVKRDEIGAFFHGIKQSVQEGKLEEATHHLEQISKKGLEYIEQHPVKTALLAGGVVATGKAVVGTMKVLGSPEVKSMVTATGLGAAAGTAIAGALSGFEPAAMHQGAIAGTKLGASLGGFIGSWMFMADKTVGTTTKTVLGPVAMATSVGVGVSTALTHLGMPVDAETAQLAADWLHNAPVVGIGLSTMATGFNKIGNFADQLQRRNLKA